MKQGKVNEIFETDPWLKRIIWNENWLADCKDEEEKNRRIHLWYESQVSHIMFRPFKGLNLKWRPVGKQLSIASCTDPDSRCDEFVDHVAYTINYKLVLMVIPENGVEQLVVEPFEALSLNNPSGSFRWKAVKYHKEIDGKIHWIAVVRNITLISQGDIMFNGYDVYKFPSNFTPFMAGWHLDQKSR